MKYSEEQKQAIDFCCDRLQSGERITTLTGLAGVGKTTVLKEIVNRVGSKAAICAYTGKASSVMRKKGMETAGTIHSKIYEWSEKSKRFFKKAKIPNNSFIVDEASMIGNYIYDDMKSYTIPMLFVGDHGQLKPIGKNTINLMESSDFCLQEIQRQAAESPIIQLAHGIRNNRDWKSFKEDTCKVLTKKPTTKQLASLDVVICGYNKTRIEKNIEIRDYLKMPKEVSPSDKMMILQNDKDLGVFNGQMFTVLKVLKRDRLRVLMDDDTERELPIARIGLNNPKKVSWDQAKVFQGNSAIVDFGYCVTCHKMQGSEAKSVGVIRETATFWDQVSWDYTSATRASEDLTIWI